MPFPKGHSHSEATKARMSKAHRGNKHARTHGLSRSSTYESWEAMKARCLNPHNVKFPEYGGRGIAVCRRWMKFENFLADMGLRPKDTSIDRINNDHNYEPLNCRWATANIQNRNRRPLQRDAKGRFVSTIFSKGTGIEVLA